ncbi:MAG: polysaccharide deacetylase family protein [bacterium]
MSNIKNKKHVSDRCVYGLRSGSILLSALFGIVSTVTMIGWLIIPNSSQLIGTSINRVKTKEKVVALTFDDGPNSPFTNQVLDVLKEHHIKATFFVVGAYAQQFPDITKEIYGAGHELGNHTWSHKVLVGKSCRFIREQINSTDLLLRDLGYTGPIYFRAPKGLKFINLAKVLAEKKRPHILFDVVAWDWSRPGVSKIVKNVIKNVRSGSIILLHDGGGDRSQTVIATDIIIKKLQKQGYRFVTISELLSKRA